MPDSSEKPGIIQEILSNRITKLVLWGTVFILATGIFFAYEALNTKVPETQIKLAFSILQYVLGILLPLWGTWIGTILAYYYSKGNFEAANKSVQQMVDKLTSDKKLEQLSVKSIMILKKDLIFKVMPIGKDLSLFKIKTDGLDFLEQKKIKRVIILDDSDHAKYVIHRDLITTFALNEIAKGKKIEDLTFEDMLNDGSAEVKNTIPNSVQFLGIDANLLDAKKLMDQQRTCLDIFITQTGKAEEPVIGWITNVTIMQNSIV